MHRLEVGNTIGRNDGNQIEVGMVAWRGCNRCYRAILLLDVQITVPVNFHVDGLPGCMAGT